MMSQTRRALGLGAAFVWVGAVAVLLTVIVGPTGQAGSDSACLASSEASGSMQGMGGMPQTLAANGCSASTSGVAYGAGQLPPLVAEGVTTAPPWSIPPDAQKPTRAALAGMTLLGSEQLALHIHAHLSITVDGKPMIVPGLVGISEIGGSTSYAPLHTHDTTGILHVESAVQREFSLGQFFTEWNVALDASRIGGLTTADGHTLTAFVNGEPYSGDPASIIFTNKMQIDLVYAAPGVTPEPAPAFDWPPQY